MPPRSAEAACTGRRVIGQPYTSRSATQDCASPPFKRLKEAVARDDRASGPRRLDHDQIEHRPRDHYSAARRRANARVVGVVVRQFANDTNLKSRLTRENASTTVRIILFGSIRWSDTMNQSDSTLKDNSAALGESRTEALMLGSLLIALRGRRASGMCLKTNETASHRAAKISKPSCPGWDPSRAKNEENKRAGCHRGI